MYELYIEVKYDYIEYIGIFIEYIGIFNLKQ